VLLRYCRPAVRTFDIRWLGSAGLPSTISILDTLKLHVAGLVTAFKNGVSNVTTFLGLELPDHIAGIHVWNSDLIVELCLYRLTKT
jgi:hypothetical protein